MFKLKMTVGPNLQNWILHPGVTENVFSYCGLVTENIFILRCSPPAQSVKCQVRWERVLEMILVFT